MEMTDSDKRTSLACYLITTLKCFIVVACVKFHKHFMPVTNGPVQDFQNAIAYFAKALITSVKCVNSGQVY
jgi:hypothetical protein